MNYPLAVFAISFLALWLSTRTGIFLRGRLGTLDDETRQDFDVVRGATLTLLGLIIGFTFSMAISRYDQRKACEEKEANAIGTEYLRVAVLPVADAAKARSLLVNYLDQRIRFFESRDADQIKQINSVTVHMQDQLWSTVEAPATGQPTPLTALAVGGMNDVLDSQGYTQAAWWNRIPTAAWCLMGAIAIGSNLLLGYGARGTKAHLSLSLALPVIVAVSFFLISDIDSPRSGVIRVRPENLISLSATLRPH